MASVSQPRKGSSWAARSVRMDAGGENPAVADCVAYIRCAGKRTVVNRDSQKVTMRLQASANPGRSRHNTCLGHAHVDAK